MKALPLALALFSWAVPSSRAALYTENFDSMGPAGTALPVNWSAGYLGVKSSVNRAVMSPYAGNGLAIGSMPVVVNDGNTPAINDGTVFNLGSAGSTDRALGGYPRTTPSGDQIMQVAIQNTSGGPLTDIEVLYAGEQWRQYQGSSSSGLEMLRFLASTTSAIDGFTYFSNLDFTAPKQAGGGIALDGNDPANRTLVSGTITLPSAVPAGGTFYLRWHDWNDNATSDHFLGIDDLQVNAVPEPGTLALFLLGFGAMLASRVRRK